MVMSNPYEQSEFQQPYPAAQSYVQAPTLPSSNAGWAVVAVIFNGLHEAFGDTFRIR